MLRLTIARQQLKSFMSDTQDLRAAQPNEVCALAKVREALALIQEAELYMAHTAPLPQDIAKLLRRLKEAGS